MRVPLDVARSVLRRVFGFPDFRPGQRVIVEAVLAGRDTLGVLPTGGGKSMCYQVPALVLPGVTLVVSPLISLMKDQVDRLVARGVTAACLNSTIPPAETGRHLLALRRGLLKLLYVAPERLEAADLRETLRRSTVSLVAVDEAHCISEWGHEFRPSFRRIAHATAELGSPQVVALTATATPRVRADIVRQLRLRHPCVVVGGFDRPNLHYAVRRCRDDAEKDATLRHELRSLSAPAVVYAPTRAAVERLAHGLRRAGMRASAYHGGLDEPARRTAQEDFMAERIRVIVGTNAFGMGIDKPNVRAVVHHAMPGTIEAYYQEAGRAGRDGGAARCALLHAPGDRSTHEWFIDGTFPDPGAVRRVYAVLTAGAVRGRVHVEPSVVARRCGAKVPVRAVAGAVGLLLRSGVLVRDPAPRHMCARLLATPARITRELADGSLERAVLATLWPTSESPPVCRFHLDEIPGDVRGRVARAVLDRLRDRQFVEYAPLEPDHRLTGIGLDAVDWDHLAARRRAELGKLEAMEQYARTGACRREVLLAYFGERASPAPCSGCDNCSAISAP